MKIKFILIGAVILLSLSFISAAMNPAPAYCEHMGYDVVDEYCFFDPCEIWEFSEGSCDMENSCNIRDFYRGDCGQEYVKEFPCRQEGEAVFSEFEGCCGNLKPYLTTGFFGQTTCQPLSKIVTNELKYNPLIWLIIVIIISIIVYIIYRVRKK